MCKLENGKACVILCLRRYNERKIVMDKKFLRHISSMMLLVCTLAAVSPVTAFAGWQKEGDTYAYYEDVGPEWKMLSANQETSGSIWMKMAIF